MKKKLLLGAHMSISGGVYTAFERGTNIGCTTMQVFTKNNNQWKGKPLTDEDIENYKMAEVKARIAPVVAHAAYLINLCATNQTILVNSRNAMVDELKRCEALGIRGLIFHPGSHMGAGEKEGVKRIAESINIAHGKTKNFRVFTTLETTAGQGSTLGYRFEQLRQIIDLVEGKERMAVCLDTCHLFAAGYNIRTEHGWKETMKQFDELIGLQHVLAIHMNDSKREFGSRVDRHEHIGKGQIGKTGFQTVMNDPRFHHIPKILETPKGEDMHEDVENMRLLRLMAKGKTERWSENSG
ncbi:MAG: deoxyribonuclease IV [Ignavibacteria bacterium]|nr:deoxyribonuclease IV [Ignavibacteria bacterium]